MKIILEGERPVSWNRFYSGMHWTVRKEEADRVHDLVGWAVKEQCPDLKFTSRVDIHITAYFKGRALDADNITAKLFIDGLVHAGVIENDTRKFVRRVTTQSELDHDNPRVEIEVI